MSKMEISKDIVIIATGHVDTKMINEVYLHQSEEDKANQITKSFKGAFQNLQDSMFSIDVDADFDPQPKIEVAKNKATIVETIPTIIDENTKMMLTKKFEEELMQEAREVLTMMGVPAHEWVHLKTVDQFHSLMYRKEGMYLEVGVERDKIKAIHNTKDKSPYEKYIALDNLFTEAIKILTVKND